MLLVAVYCPRPCGQCRLTEQGICEVYPGETLAPLTLVGAGVADIFTIHKVCAQIARVDDRGKEETVDRGSVQLGLVAQVEHDAGAISGGQTKRGGGRVHGSAQLEVLHSLW